jgi:hypothetical protein
MTRIVLQAAAVLFASIFAPAYSQILRSVTPIGSPPSEFDDFLTRFGVSCIPLNNRPASLKNLECQVGDSLKAWLEYWQIKTDVVTLIENSGGSCNAESRNTKCVLYKKFDFEKYVIESRSTKNVIETFHVFVEICAEDGCSPSIKIDRYSETLTGE